MVSEIFDCTRYGQIFRLSRIFLAKIPIVLFYSKKIMTVRIFVLYYFIFAEIIIYFQYIFSHCLKVVSSQFILSLSSCQPIIPYSVQATRGDPILSSNCDMKIVQSQRLQTLNIPECCLCYITKLLNFPVFHHTVISYPLR